jgi:hypothetical protein
MTERKPTYLSKTSYVNGLACRKWLWLKFNDPDKLPKADESSQYRIEEGRKIGELARELFPSGILLKEDSVEGNDQLSRSMLQKRRPLFEAGFIHPNGKCYARADILVPDGKDGWDIVEVKSSTGVKVEHVHDLSFQNYCYTKAGLKVRRCILMHINGQYVRRGEIALDELFSQEDITEKVLPLSIDVPSIVKGFLDLAASRECPEFGNGEPFHSDEAGVHDTDAIWKKHPNSDILDLYRGGEGKFKYLESGIFRIQDIPKGDGLKGKQLVQYDSHKTGEPHVEREKLDAFLKSLKFPLQFLDFETYNTGIPLYDGLKPYEQLPFQFSLHVIEKAGQKKPVHHSFIAEGPEDPREEFLKALHEAIRPNGNIVVYNQSFEKGVLERLGSHLPKYQSWVGAVTSRFVDLLVPFREFAYYSPKQHGSASLKAVLPALTGHSYDGLGIAEGSQASNAYLFITHGSYDGQKATAEEREKVMEDLKKYCGQDTEGMVWIIDTLRSLACEE